MSRPALPVLAAGLFLLAAPALPAAEAPLPEGLYAEIGTPHGPVTCELHFRQAPRTVASFVGLAEGTLGPAPRRPYFDGLKFHRVVPEFVVQGGDPTGTGDGGPGYSFPDEFTPGLRHDAAGVLSMANKGPDTNGSQFFLTLREVNRLNYLHSVFGRVVRGLEVLPRLRQGDAMTVRIARIGAAAKAFRADDESFAALVERGRRHAVAAEPGPEAHFDDPDRLLPAEPPRAKTFNHKLANVERALGLVIKTRLRAKSPTPAEDAEPGAFMRGLAAKLGTARDGALAVYFADEDDWRLWIGDERVARFAGKPGTPEELTRSGAMHEAKEAFLKSAREAGDATLREQEASAKRTGLPAPPPGQHLKLQTDAILDGLISKLEGTGAAR